MIEIPGIRSRPRCCLTVLLDYLDCWEKPLVVTKPSSPSTLRAIPTGLIYLATGLTFVIGAWPALSLETDDQIGLLLRVTARLAFALLLLAYVAQPLVQLFGVGQPLLRRRRHLGWCMAVVHTIHFGFVIAYLRQTGETLEPIVLLFGGLAFLLMWLMALTSNRVSQRYLGANWRRLHLIGIHYLWLIFMQTFAGIAAAESSNPLYWLLIGMGLLALGLRLSAYIARPS